MLGIGYRVSGIGYWVLGGPPREQLPHVVGILQPGHDVKVPTLTNTIPGARGVTGIKLQHPGVRPSSGFLPCEVHPNFPMQDVSKCKDVESESDITNAMKQDCLNL